MLSSVRKAASQVGILSRVLQNQNTSSQKQNERLLVGNKFIAALSDMDKIHPTAKMFATRLTNGYVNYDMYNNGFKVNPEMLKV